VVRYDEEELLQLGNLISSVFYIDQKPWYDEIIRRLKILTGQLKNLNEDELKMFMVWLRNIAVSGMTAKEKVEVEKIIDESKEVDEMVYALEIAIRNMREEMKMQGKTEGLQEGVEKGKMEGRAEGRAEGRVEGERNAKIEVVKKMFAMGKDIKEISYITGLTDDEIRRLA